MTTRKKSRKHTVRLYLDVAQNLYWTVPLTVAKTAVDVPVKVGTLKHAKKGYPWACWLAEAIMAHVKEHPRAFPHPVKYAYVIASAVFLIDKLKGQPIHAVKYKHNFGPVIQRFDTMTKPQFMRYMNGDGELVLRLKPGRKRRIGESRVGGNGTGGDRTLTVSKGAKRRAIAAGLLPAVGRQTTEQMFT